MQITEKEEGGGRSNCMQGETIFPPPMANQHPLPSILPSQILKPSRSFSPTSKIKQNRYKLERQPPPSIPSARPVHCVCKRCLVGGGGGVLPAPGWLQRARSRHNARLQALPLLGLHFKGCLAWPGLRACPPILAPSAARRRQYPPVMVVGDQLDLRSRAAGGAGAWGGRMGTDWKAAAGFSQSSRSCLSSVACYCLRLRLRLACERPVNPRPGVSNSPRSS